MTNSSSKGAGRQLRSLFRLPNDDYSSSKVSWKNSQGHAFDSNDDNSSSKRAGRIASSILSDFQTNDWQLRRRERKNSEGHVLDFQTMTNRMSKGAVLESTKVAF
ncbi:hypothetical protein AVEN_168818-1 [Araneus ventricosus]|uniref:Uncharacterized protein n=1 Tax=Araneus ventricosus TaxID=182803 RepID=A0A4Y2P6U7_ARAVE|nr:hypothetical protein AVEN_168818-1 [Araneus ventricosus]